MWLNDYAVCSFWATGATVPCCLVQSECPVHFLLSESQRPYSSAWIHYYWWERDIIIIAGERAKRGSRSVFGCQRMNAKVYFLFVHPSLWRTSGVVGFFSGVSPPVSDKHFTDDRFLNLGSTQSRTRPDPDPEIKSGSVPSLLGSATNLETTKSTNISLRCFSVCGYLVNLLLYCIWLPCYPYHVAVALALQLTAHSLSLV